jgi:hypothetical protein
VFGAPKRSPSLCRIRGSIALMKAGVEGEYQAPGWDQACPRLDPNGRPTCEHTADQHDYDGVYMACASSPAAFARPCAKPIPEEERGMDSILKLRGRDVRLVIRDHTQMACGRLQYADDKVVQLAPIDRPMQFTRNGGKFRRDEIEDIALIPESWRGDC